jgi:hypothetical protein
MIDILIDRAVADNFWTITSILAIIYFLILKENIYNIFDPLFLTIIGMSTTGAFITRLWLLGDIADRYLLSYYACNLFMIIGFKFNLSFKLSTQYQKTLRLFQRPHFQQNSNRDRKGNINVVSLPIEDYQNSSHPDESKIPNLFGFSAAEEVEDRLDESDHEDRLSIQYFFDWSQAESTPEIPKIDQDIDRTPTISQQIDKNQEDEFNMHHLFIFLITISVIHLLTLLYIYLTIGLAIFSDNPAEARVGISAAFRWGNVILEGSRSTGLITSIFLMLYARSGRIFKRIVSFLAFLLFVFSFLSVGNKAAVFDLAFALGSYFIYSKSVGKKVPKFLNYLVYGCIGLGTVYFSFASSGDAHSNDGLQKLLLRVALSGDAYIYFFVDEQYEAMKFTYNIFTYLLHLVTSPFGFKLVEYNIGLKLYGLSTGDFDSGFGPNPQYVVEGMIFFGMYLAPIYALAIGRYLRCAREFFMYKKGNYNLIGFMVLMGNSTSIPVDINMSTFNLISRIMISGIAYVIANIILGYNVFSISHRKQNTISPLQ